MGPLQFPHFAVRSPKTATDQNHGIGRAFLMQGLQNIFHAKTTKCSCPLSARARASLAIRGRAPGASRKVGLVPSHGSPEVVRRAAALVIRAEGLAETGSEVYPHQLLGAPAGWRELFIAMWGRWDGYE